MKNVTIRLDERTAVRARRHASQLGMSLSRNVREVLEKSLREATAYEQAMRRQLERKPRLLSEDRARYPSREELYDRGRFR